MTDTAVFYVTYTDLKRKPIEGYVIDPFALESAVNAGAKKIELRHRVHGAVWQISLRKYETAHKVIERDRVLVPLKSLSKIDNRDPRGWEA